jgi:hypothetical protein
MINKRNWTISVILAGIIFFTIVGFILASKVINLSSYTKTVLTYWCVGLFFSSFLSLSLLRKDFYKEPLNQRLEFGLFYPLSLLLTAIIVEMRFYPTISLILFLISWILWAIILGQNKGTSFSFINVLVISWMVLSTIMSLGQVLGYSTTLVENIHQFSFFLDLRFTLLIVILALVVIMSLERIDQSKIVTVDLLSINNDKGNPVLIIVGIFFILMNFLIRIFWWLGVFIMLWAQEFVNELKNRFVESKDSFFDLAIIVFSILGLFVALVLSQKIILEYLPINNTFKETIPFLYNAFLVSTILLLDYLIIRFRYISWNNWTPLIRKNSFDSADRNFREALGFPILTSGIAGIILFGLGNLNSLKFEYFNNYGFFSLLLSIGLILAIIITSIKHLSKTAIRDKE